MLIALLTHVQCNYTRIILFLLDYIKRSCLVLLGKLCFSHPSPCSHLSVVNSGNFYEAKIGTASLENLDMLLEIEHSHINEI